MISFNHASMATLVNYFGDQNGFSKIMLGLLTSITYFGFFLGSMFLMRLINRVSYIRGFAISAGGAAICSLAISLKTDPALWFIFRMLGGMAMGMAFAISESWLNLVCEKGTKGKLYAIYLVINYAGLGSSQLLLYYSDQGPQLAMTLSAMVAILALFPLCLTRFPEPAGGQESRQLSFKECYQISRLSCVGVTLAGLCYSISSLIVVFGRNLDFKADMIVAVSVIMLVSSVFFQIPIGAISDRVKERRMTLLALCLVISGFGLITIACARIVPPVALLVPIFFFAGILPTIYPLCMSLGTDLVSRENMTPLIARLYQYYFIGSITGPLITGTLMELFSVEWLFIVPVLAMSVLAMLCMSNRFMPKLRPLTVGPYIQSGSLAAVGAAEQLQMQTLDKEDLFIGPLVPDEEGIEKKAQSELPGPVLPEENQENKTNA